MPAGSFMFDAAPMFAPSGGSMPFEPIAAAPALASMTLDARFLSGPSKSSSGSPSRGRLLVMPSPYNEMKTRGN